MIKLKDLIVENLNTTAIPDVLYHATFNALIPRIYQLGLLPKDDEILHNFGGIEPGIYLAENAEYAASMVEASENENIPEEWFSKIVIIRINTKKLNLSKLDVDPNVLPQEDEYDDTVEPDSTVYSYIYRGTIPPSSFIDITDYDN